MIQLYGSKILTVPSKKVEIFDNGLYTTVTELIKILREHGQGVGLSANQIGSSLRVAVMEVDEERKQDPLPLVNPEILDLDGETTLLEGCLSLPEVSGMVTRAKDVTVKFSEVNGTERTVVFSGFAARIVQHEIDHLNGILFINRLNSYERGRLRNKLKVLLRRGERLHYD